MARQWMALACIALACAALSGCGRNPAPAPPPATRATPLPAASSDDFSRTPLRPGDVIHVEIADQLDLTRDAVIRFDGKITLTLLDDVAVANMTPGEVAEKLTRLYSEYIVDPRVTVTRIAGAEPPVVYVWGEVAKPGAQPLTPDLRLNQALSKAGLTSRAEVKAIELRRGDKLWKIDFGDIVGQAREQTQPLQRDDIIFVPLSAGSHGESSFGEALYPLARFPDPGQAKPDPATDGAWGAAVDGIQARLVADRSQWKAGEFPTLTAEVRDLRQRRSDMVLLVVPVRSGLRLEIDGVVYAPVRPFSAEPLPLPAGQFEPVAVALDPEKWVREGKGHPDLKPGKHVVRVAIGVFVNLARAGDVVPGLSARSTPVIVVTRLVEVEIPEPGTPKADAP